MKNILTIDLEEWYHANYSEGLFDNSQQYETRVVRNTEILIDLFDAYNVKATFFTLGVIAEQFPELIRTLHARGHEIATHGYGHQLVYKQDKREFEEDLLKSISYIEKAIGDKPIGYRAPSWSVNEDTCWVYPILKKNGILYDSSIFPVKTFLYGFPGAPRFPFSIEFGQDEILEFPMSTIKIGNQGIPFSGGFYFRFLPYPLIKMGFRQINRSGNPSMFYLHPREIDTEQPRLDNLNRRDRFIHYFGLAGSQAKLEKLLADFDFTTVKDYFFGNERLVALPKKYIG
ncbi:XrtA system polysaccharide deacetylase [Cohnella sp.]|uniref:XrtA system polysaccharide deacetylase n=1 Tax=Cohnella sp. TaxID=1883426 RepID=UPI00356A6766